MVESTSTASATSPTALPAKKKRKRCSRKKRKPARRRRNPEKQPRSPVKKSQKKRSPKKNPSRRKLTPSSEVRGEACHFIPPRPLFPLPPNHHLLPSNNERARRVPHLRHHSRQNLHPLRRADCPHHAPVSHPHNHHRLP